MLPAKYCAMGSESSTAQQNRRVANFASEIAFASSALKREYLSTIVNELWET
jgi:hypothetical protein